MIGNFPLFEQTEPTPQSPGPQVAEALDRLYIMRKLIHILYQLRANGIDNDDVALLDAFTRVYNAFTGQDFYQVAAYLLTRILKYLGGQNQANEESNSGSRDSTNIGKTSGPERGNNVNRSSEAQVQNSPSNTQ